MPQTYFRTGAEIVNHVRHAAELLGMYVVDEYDNCNTHRTATTPFEHRPHCPTYIYAYLMCLADGQPLPEDLEDSI